MILYKSGYSYHFLGTNQQKADIKLFSFIQQEIRMYVIGTFWRVITKELYRITWIACDKPLKKIGIVRINSLSKKCEKI